MTDRTQHVIEQERISVVEFTEKARAAREIHDHARAMEYERAAQIASQKVRELEGINV